MYLSFRCQYMDSLPFFCVITSSSLITDFLQSNISSRTINVSLNHMHFIVLVSIWGILMCILDLTCVFVVTLVGSNLVCIVINKLACAKLVWTSTNTPTYTMLVWTCMDMPIGVTSLSFVYSNCVPMEVMVLKTPSVLL